MEVLFLFMDGRNEDKMYYFCIMNVIKRFPLTAVCVILIWYLCFFTPPETVLSEVPLMDKWTHFVMYGGTTSVFWFECWRNVLKGFVISKKVQIIIGVICPILMSGLIELLQATCTGGRRSGEWLDVLANSIGVILGWCIGNLILKRYILK